MELDLVTIVPRRGIAIAPIDLVDTIRLYEARLVVEAGALRLAAERGKIAALEQLTEQHPPVERMFTEVRPENFVEIDAEFHPSVVALSGNVSLRRALERLMPAHIRIWYRLLGEMGGDERFLSHHSALIDAIARDDTEEAES